MGASRREDPSKISQNNLAEGSTPEHYRASIGLDPLQPLDITAAISGEAGSRRATNGAAERTDPDNFG